MYILNNLENIKWIKEKEEDIDSSNTSIDIVRLSETRNFHKTISRTV